VEDFPFIFKAMKSGERFFHLNKELVIYRVHESSISNGKEDKLKNTFINFFNLEFYPYIRVNDFLLYRNITLSNSISYSRSKYIKLLIYLLIRTTDPYYWYFNYHKFCFNRRRWSAVLKIDL
jgi:hypothetical protein